ncbi:hypothetical protein [Polyangium sp. 15x6]|uniref:hypothetical protein n=1 Tax=Polyangium sp. 15x6 TaxID=3042687 RepID=UPI00249A372E|nr:hypothetical protein [Polyangium sp. 15x6]MDI3288553.1 hypothetical protein [Polyangium sp. 15x6]
MPYIACSSVSGVVHVAERDGLAEKKAAQESAVFQVEAAEQGVRRRKVCRRRMDDYRDH